MIARRRRTALALALAAAAALAPLALAPAGCAKHAAEAALWYCPMHPEYTSDRAGECPICHMRLVQAGTDRKAAEAGHAGASAPGTTPPATAPAAATPAPARGSWTCPMAEDDYFADGPGTCPRCGMDLVPVKPAPAAAPPPAGLAPVDAGLEGLRLAGVKTVAATRRTLSRTVRAAGRVVVDESRVRHVHAKIAGVVERLDATVTGQAVRRGQALLSLYSPELLATQEEFLRAAEAGKRLSASSLAEVRRGAADLVSAARRRLELFDVPPGFIERIARTGTPERTVPLPSPVAGVVTAKNVFEGQQVDPSMDLFVVTDLSRVWLEADLYESEASRVRVGTPARVTLPYAAGAPVDATVAFVQPVVSSDTRTLRVRLDLPNRDGALRPGMFADVDVVLDAVEGVAVPDGAVVDTGTRQVVFVSPSEGRFVPRTVTVALRADGVALLSSGLAEGEAVAATAAFLLDSESRLRAALGAP